MKLAVDLVVRHMIRTVPDGSLDSLSATDTLQSQLAHQAFHRAPRKILAFALHLVPHLARTIVAEARNPYTFNVSGDNRIVLRTRTEQTGITAFGEPLVVRRWGDLQFPANRLDPMLLSVRVDEAD